MFLRKNLYVPGLQILARCTLALLFLLAIALRVSLYHVVTSDYTFFLSQWYDFIQTHGGFAALKYNFSNYNPPYLYLLALTTYLPIPKLVAIKTLSVAFDGVLGLFAYLILSLKYRRAYASIVGVLVILFAPTIVINSSAWGQSDAIYTAFCLGSLYFYAFYFPRYFFIAVIVQLCSLLSYAPYFLNTQIVNLAYVAFAILVIIVITITDLVLTLYPNIRKKAAMQEST